MENNTQELLAVEAVEPQPIVATVGVVTELHAIDGADRIRSAVVDCGYCGTWSGVVTLDIGPLQKVLVLLQDALLPESERWAFMAKHKNRVRMARFKKVPSECVILPLTSEEFACWNIGSDVGPALGITKYSKPIAAEMAGKAKGNFPSFIPKTDEPNFQRVRDRDQLMDCEWYATVKYDGTSCTAYNLDGVLHVCSRNLDLEDGDNLYWNVARKYHLERIPPGYAVQFEIIGPGVQGNPLGLADHEIRVFTEICFGAEHPLEVRGRLEAEDMAACMHILNLPTAEVVATGRGPLTNAELQKMAEIKYPNGRHGEGVVVRGLQNQFSFKALSLLYKD